MWALVRAAQRVTVRLLLSGAWYDRGRNRGLAASLNNRVDRSGLGLAAVVTEARDRYAKVHTKEDVVDDTAVVGSINWNAHSAERNRELVLALDHPAAADYFARVFVADWRGGRAQLPAGLVDGFTAALLAAAATARQRVSFATPAGQ